MKEWQTKRPELFAKRVVNHKGPDTYILNLISIKCIVDYFLKGFVHLLVFVLG